jgi:hypothetical protein
MALVNTCSGQTCMLMSDHEGAKLQTTFEHDVAQHRLLPQHIMALPMCLVYSVSDPMLP